MIKFMKYYVTDGSVKARVHYHTGTRIRDGRRYIVLFAKSFDDGRRLGEILPDVYENDTDIQTDYFDEGKAYLFEDHHLYQAAKQRAEGGR